MIKKKTFFEVLFILTLLFSIFSQIEDVESVMRPLMYSFWILTLGLCIFARKGKLALTRSTRLCVGLYLLFIAFCVVCGFFNTQFLSSRYLRVLIVPIIVIVFVDICPKEIVKDYETLAKVYVIAALSLAVIVQRNYISSYSEWLSAHSYIYEQKNSAAQIWFCGILLCWFVLNPKTKKSRVFWYAVSAYLLLVSGLSQCRTAILAFVTGIITIILFRSKHKFRWAAFFVVVLTLALIHPLSREYINQALLLDKYAGGNLDKFSSGRLTNYSQALKMFVKSPIIGVGSWYVDCSYLLILAESGIIGFLIIEPMWIDRIKNNFSTRFLSPNSDRKKNFVVIITVFYTVESILEGFPPFGPGVSALGFWLFVGLLIRYERVYLADTCDDLVSNVKLEGDSLKSGKEDK